MLLKHGAPISMVWNGDIPYSRICVIYVLRPSAVGFALRNVCDIF